MISFVSLPIKGKTEITVHVVAAGICRIKMRSHGKFHYWAHMREQ